MPRASLRPLQNAPFCPISASHSNFNPQNTQCIPAVKISALLELEPRLNKKADLTGQAKMSIFQRSLPVRSMLKTKTNLDA
jgi:hypothetical protein